jgi:hypothetical protein
MSAAVFLIIAVTSTGLIWFEAQRMREYVIRRCSAICSASGLQLLDETVALSALRVQRDYRGRLHLHRRYQFDVSERGTDRLRGWITLTGMAVEQIHIDGTDGAVILDQDRRLLQ